MEHVQAKKEIERRNYFRIDDVVILHYRIISGEDKTRTLHDDSQLSIDKLTLKARFDSISRELLPLFRVIEAGSPEIAQYLSSIDKKLNLLSEYYVEIAMGDMDMSPQKVNLGAGGVNFTSPNPIMSGAELELKIVLLPEHYGVFSFAKVISCVRNSADADDNSGYKISVEFQRMNDDVRDIITRHVLNKEQQAISNDQFG